jgi:hypothetical protein
MIIKKFTSPFAATPTDQVPVPPARRDRGPFSGNPGQSLTWKGEVCSMQAILLSKCRFRRRPHFVPFTKGEVAFMERFKAGELKVDAGTILLMEASNAPRIYPAPSGMGMQYTTLSKRRRQLAHLPCSGDVVGLQAGLLGKKKHSVGASTRMTLRVFRRALVR